MSGEWEERVREELRQLRDLWSKYRAKVLLPAVREARARGTRDALDEAVNMEVFAESVDALFAEAEGELEAETRARRRGDEFNAVIAAQRAAEALEMLRIYARGWREKLQGVGGSG
jgi:hypothetical protein